MGSFSTSLSGIEAASQDLAVISNNLANLDTTAYKDQEANFQDFFYQMLGTDGAGNPTQIGAGSVIASVISAFTQGTINSTGVPTDMAIQGNGFFLEQNGTTTLYTRAGDFSQNANRYLVTSDGGYVLGYPAVNGVISPSATLAPIQISNGQIIPPNATADVELTMNLDASAAVASGTAGTDATGVLTVTGNANAGETVTIGGTTYTFVTALSTGPTVPDQVLIDTTGAAGTLANLAAAINGTAGGGTTYSTGTAANASVTATAAATTLSLSASSPGTTGNSIATTTTMADGTFGAATLTGGAAATSTGGASFSEPVVVYDSLGTSHTLTFTFTKTAANTWTYQITIPAADVGGTGSPVVVNNGTLQFNGNGQLTSPTANVTGISVTNLADGANALNVTWQLFDPTTGTPQITQTAGSSNVSSTQQDGYASGALQSFTINSDGSIQGVFSNGQTLTLGQVALATFQNTQGLQLNGDNTYLATPSAGNPSIGTPATGGRGTIVGQSLESSNADMTAELSNLIVAERNYQANARAISTADQMINYVLTMQP
jgi:flagellar hook protein FlgE